MQYYILSVSKKAAHLCLVSGGTIKPIPADGMPQGIDDVLKGMEREDGQEEGKDVREEEENMYYHAVSKSLHTILHEQHLPVIVAAVAIFPPAPFNWIIPAVGVPATA